MAEYRDADIFGSPEAPKTGYRDPDIFGTAPPEKQDVGGTQYKIGAEGLPQAIRETLSKYSYPERALMQLYSSVVGQPALRVKQLAGKYGPEEQASQAAFEALRAGPEQTVEQQEKAVARPPFGGISMRYGAPLEPNTTPAPFPPPSAETVGDIAGKSLLGLRVGPGYLANMGYGAGLEFFGKPVKEGESGLMKAASGAALGGGLTAAGRLATGAPMFPVGPVSERLMGRGVQPTIGQTLSEQPGWLPREVSQAEQLVSSWPLLGNLTQGARNRALGEVRTAQLRMGSPPGARVPESPGIQDVLSARGALQDRYNDIYRHVVIPDPQRAFGPGSQFFNTVQRARGGGGNLPLNQEMEQQFDRIVRSAIYDRLPAGPITGTEAKTQIESALGQAIRQYGKSAARNSDPNHRALVDALEQVRGEWRNTLNQHMTNPAAITMRPDIDRRWAANSNLLKAAENAQAQGGQWTPNQLQRVLTNANIRPTVNRPTGGDLRSIADDAQAILPSRYPDSGSAGRGALMMAAAPILAGTGAYQVGMPALALAGLAPMVYSRTGLQWLHGGTTPREIQAMAPFLGRGFTAGLLNQSE